jgi:hypothetical protein
MKKQIVVAGFIAAIGAGAAGVWRAQGGQPIHVLTIASSKDGPGKTTVAMLIAGRLAAEGIKVVALDADPTMALSRWAQNAYEGPAFGARAETDEAQLAHLIDAENRADAVLIPTLSGEADIREFSGRVPDQGPAGEELTRLVAELRTIGWIPEYQDVST